MDPEGQAEHEARRLAGSGIQEVRLEPGWVFGEVRQNARSGIQKICQSVAVQSKGASA